MLKVNIAEKKLFCAECNSDSCEHITGALNNLGYESLEALFLQENLKKFRRRIAPQEETVALLNSEYITRDLYTITRHDDGTFGCNCPAFISGKVQPLPNNSAACKHIIKELPNLQAGQSPFVKKATEYQKLLLTVLNNGESFPDANPYSGDQAYYVISRLLKKQGLMFKELEQMLSEGKKPSLLPLYSFGLEYEAGGVPRERIKELMKQNGYHGYCSDSYRSIEEGANAIGAGRNGIAQGGSRAVVPGSPAPNGCLINIGNDGSVHLDKPFEAKTTRISGLFGKNSLESFLGFLRILKDNGMTTNNSCGTHMHIGVYGWKPEELNRAVNVWNKFEKKFIRYLVPQHRRDNHYTKLLTPRDMKHFKQNILMGEADILDRNYETTPTPAQSQAPDMEVAFSGLRHKSLNFTGVKWNRTKGILNGTVEIRLLDSPSGPHMEKYIKSWVIFNLKLFEMAGQKNVFERMTPRKINALTFPEFLEKIGIDESTPVMKQARKDLIEKFDGLAPPRTVVTRRTYTPEERAFKESLKLTLKSFLKVGAVLNTNLFFDKIREAGPFTSFNLNLESLPGTKLTSDAQIVKNVRIERLNSPGRAEYWNSSYFYSNYNRYYSNIIFDAVKFSDGNAAIVIKNQGYKDSTCIETNPDGYKPQWVYCSCPGEKPCVHHAAILKSLPQEEVADLTARTQKKVYSGNAEFTGVNISNFAGYKSADDFSIPLSDIRRVYIRKIHSFINEELRYGFCVGIRTKNEESGEVKSCVIPLNGGGEDNSRLFDVLRETCNNENVSFYSYYDSYSYNYTNKIRFLDDKNRYGRGSAHTESLYPAFHNSDHCKKCRGIFMTLTTKGFP